MRLVRCRDEEGERYSVLTNNEVIFLPSLTKRLNEKLPELLEEFIALGAKGVETAERLLEKATEHEIEHASSLVDGVTLLAPVSAPPKIVCLGLNYRDHAEEKLTS